MVFIIVFTAVAGAAAQNGYSVSGTVTFGGAAVEGAVVTLTRAGETEPKYKAASNAEGTFGFYAAPGNYVLKATAIRDGKEIAASAEVAVRVGKHERFELQLTEAGAIRETVNISADAEQPVEQVSKSVDVIGGQEMRERADFSLTESLRTIPGFRVQQLGGFGRTASIKTRGLRNQDTAMLIDGIRMRDASSITGDATPFLSDLTLTSVSKVEVLRGSGSSLYGTNAIGGTIDLRTPEPQPGMHGQVSGAFGGYGLRRFRGNLSDGTKDGKFGFNFGASRTVYTKGIDGEDDAHNTNFQGRVELSPWTRSNFSGRFFVTDAYVRLNSDPDTLGDLPASNFGVIDAQQGVNFVTDVNDPDNAQRSKLFNGQFVFNHVISSDLVFQAYYSGLKSSRKNTNGSLGSGFQSDSTSIFDGLIQTANAHFEWTPNSVNRITAGYEFEHEKFGNKGFTPDGAGNFFTRAYQSSHTLYAQDLIGLMDGRLQLAGGFRAQFFGLGDAKFSLSNAPYSGVALEDPPAAYTFDGSASYFFRSTGTKLRAHAGSGYRVPSLYERFGTFYSSFGTPSFIALGDPSLKPERSAAFDAGIEQNIFGDKARLSAVYFYTKLIDTIGFGNVVPPIGGTQRPFGGYLNQNGGIARGAEFSGRVRPSSGTEVFVSYTFTNSDQREPQVTGSGVIDSLGIADHQFTAVATQTFERFWINLDVTATSSYLAPIFSNSSFSTYVYRFGGMRRADVTAGYTFPIKGERMSLRVFGTAENLFDQEYFENGFRTFGRNGRIGLSFGF